MSILFQANQVYLRDHWTPKSYCKRCRTKLKPWHLYQKSSSTVIQSPEEAFHITHSWQSSGLTRWLDTRKFTLICASIRITIIGWKGFWWTLSAPWRSVLWELLQPYFLHFLGFGHCLNICFSLRHEKHSFATATTFARWVGNFSLNTLHSQMRWWPLHTMKRGVGGLADVEAGLWMPLVCVLAAKVLEANLVLSTELLLSSVLAFD